MGSIFLLYIIGPVLLAVIIFGALRFFEPTHLRTFNWYPKFLYERSVGLDIVQGIFIGIGLAFITLLFILPDLYVTKVNGWTTMYGCGEPGNGIFLRAACNITFAGPVNVPQEAMYWTTKIDGSGQALSGAHDYVLHFPAGQLPPNNAFWSLTMADAQQHFVPNSINRYNLSSQSGLVPNADGSVDIYIQNTPPAGHETNWLPAPTGNFLLWLRVYLPGQTVLNGEYKVPPIVETQ
jgi:hypothetical protein